MIDGLPPEVDVAQIRACEGSKAHALAVVEWLRFHLWRLRWDADVILRRRAPGSTYAETRRMPRPRPAAESAFWPSSYIIVGPDGSRYEAEWM